ncbi:UDP-4-amino-4,6-dideoxy-N-acetyl-beta-L-altrosamine transaminase [Terricaulis sp.]|uniref:UDP-4-amino-4, 6-dideoxy-N-acetyl-beta-L-altrosamine transaminase n=1 Tax=Terricaulis sp. TaxID=2768686 RepID=UPI003784314B
MAQNFLPYGRHCIDEADIAAVSAVLRGDFLTTGPNVDAFETAFAAAVDAPYAISCANGTAALHLAMLALDVGEGDACIVPTITFLATANCARYAGAEVVFADVDPDTGLMTAATFEAALAKAKARGLRPRVVLPVHLSGHAVAIDELAEIAEREGLAIVEDACHAIGSQVRTGGTWRPVGACSRSAMSVFSFHPVKTIACGEGGAVTTRDPALAKRLKRLRSHGMVREAAEMSDSSLSLDAGGLANPWSYEMPDIGFNYRQTDIQSALGLSQLRKLDHFKSRRAGLAAAYDKALARCGNWVAPVRPPTHSRATLHLYVALIDFDAIGVTRAQAMRKLHEQGIGTQVHYIPVHRQPYYVARYGGEWLEGAERYYKRCLSLPLFPDMADSDVERVVRALETLPVLAPAV